MNNITLEMLSCGDCGQRYKYKKSLLRHVRNFHNDFGAKKKRKYHITCAICKGAVTTYDQYFNHLEIKHGVLVSLEMFQFDTWKAFENWKTNLEQSTNSLYVRETGTKIRKNNAETSYYFCHRSYEQATKNKKNPKRSKLIGSNKMGNACPARIKIIHKDEKFEILFCGTHLGHDMELIRCRISENERRRIAELLAGGVPVSKILRDAKHNTSAQLSDRVQLLNRHDLHNIKRDFRILCPFRKHNSDSMSVESLVQEISEIVIFYKNSNTELPEYNCLQKDDFVLILMSDFQKTMLEKFASKIICVDSTRALNLHDFVLYTLLIIDERNEGCPVAFCFTNRQAPAMYEFFFDKIKSNIGHLVETEIFMSSAEIAFYDSWSKKMGESKIQLLCHRHVRKNWQEMVSQIKNVTKRRRVSDALDVLIEEPIKEKFHQQLSIFLNNLQFDDDTRTFYEYFATYYLLKVESWAKCYRPHLDVYTHMHVDAVHKSLKYHVINGKNVLRLDESIYNLSVLMQAKANEKSVNISSVEETKKLKLIEKSHDQLRLVTRVTKIDDDNWTVRMTRIDQLYRVTRISEGPPCCILRCNTCAICIHSFRCSCIENVIKLNICEHIHACRKYSQQDKTSENVIFDGSLSALSDENNVGVNPHPDVRDHDQFHFWPDETSLKCDLIKHSCKELTFDSETMNKVNMFLDEALNELHAKKSSKEDQITNCAVYENYIVEVEME